MSELLAGPLTFEPRYRDYVWGGRNLARLLGRDLPSGIVAESWEVSAHPTAPTVADRGPLRGRALVELAAEHGAALVGRNAERACGPGRFPLLVKLLDAAEPLSVQVHPGDAHAFARHGELGKTEMWHVLHADPGAEIVCGLTPGTDEAGLRRALAADKLDVCLNRLQVQAGDSVLVPAGTVHAILGGSVILEVQQSSDVTYRLHDWGRLGPDGRPRQLHVESALEAIDFAGAPPKLSAHHAVEDAGDVTRQVLAECAAFVVERFSLAPGAVLDRRVDPGSCEIWGVVEGAASVAAQPASASGARRSEPFTGPDEARSRVAGPHKPMHREVELPAVRFALLPAVMGDFALRTTEGAVAVRVYIPSPPPKCPARDSNPEPAD